MKISKKEIDLSCWCFSNENFNFAEASFKDCGDICGDSEDCRYWVYKGVEHQEPPKEMIVNAIMRKFMEATPT